MTEKNKSYEQLKNEDIVVIESAESYALSQSPLQTLVHILGLNSLSDKIKNMLDLLILTEQGFPINVLKRLQAHTKFTNREMGKALDMSESTLQRRLKQEQKLDKRQSESAVQLASVWAKGLEVFEEEDFRTWLHSDNKALGGNKPISILNSSIGREEVKDVLRRIEWGIYS